MEEKKTLKEHFQAFKDEAKWKWKECKAWCRDNQETVVGIAIVGIPAVTKLARCMISGKRHSDEEHHRNRSVYDPVHHHTYEAKRDIKTREWAEIDRRKDNGESVYDILRDMRLL